MPKSKNPKPIPPTNRKTRSAGDATPMKPIDEGKLSQTELEAQRFLNRAEKKRSSSPGSESPKKKAKAKSKSGSGKKSSSPKKTY